MKTGWAMALLAAATLAAALDSARIAPFSTATAGATLPAGWRALSVAHRKAPEFSLVPDHGTTVVRIYADAAVGSAAHLLVADPESILTWRWKIDHVLEKANLGTREGDDFAARVYVSFDVPLQELALGTRLKLQLARLIYGADLPAAAICYVWDNRHPVGTSVWNPYSETLRMVVLESGDARAGEWVSERRDLDADFRAAFGAVLKGPTPRISGVAVSSDTDQTGETVTAWFSDLRLEARP